MAVKSKTQDPRLLTPSDTSTHCVGEYTPCYVSPLRPPPSCPGRTQPRASGRQAVTFTLEIRSRPSFSSRPMYLQHTPISSPTPFLQTASQSRTGLNHLTALSSIHDDHHHRKRSDGSSPHTHRASKSPGSVPIWGLLQQSSQIRSDEIRSIEMRWSRVDFHPRTPARGAPLMTEAREPGTRSPSVLAGGM